MKHELELRGAIHETIRKMKRKGTTGASVDCLKQNVDTQSLTSSPGWFHANFERIAIETASKLKFAILKGGE